MEQPDINLNQIEAEERYKKQERFNELLKQLEQLPKGEDVEEKAKENVFTELLTMLVKKDFFPPDQYNSLVDRATQVFDDSLMNERDFAAKKAWKELELDKKYSVAGFTDDSDNPVELHDAHTRTKWSHDHAIAKEKSAALYEKLEADRKVIEAEVLAEINGKDAQGTIQTLVNLYREHATSERGGGIKWALYGEAVRKYASKIENLNLQKAVMELTDADGGRMLRALTKGASLATSAVPDYAEMLEDGDAVSHKAKAEGRNPAHFISHDSQTFELDKINKVLAPLGFDSNTFK